MALKYRYECPNGHSFPKFREQEKRNEPVICEECSEMAERDRMTEMENQNPQEFESYVEDVLLDEPVKVTSREQKKKIMKREGVKEKGAYT